MLCLTPSVGLSLTANGRKSELRIGFIFLISIEIDCA
jgi:hypothetical protein